MADRWSAAAETDDFEDVLISARHDADNPEDDFEEVVLPAPDGRADASEEMVIPGPEEAEDFEEVEVPGPEEADDFEEVTVPAAADAFETVVRNTDERREGRRNAAQRYLQNLEIIEEEDEEIRSLEIHSPVADAVRAKAYRRIEEDRQRVPEKRPRRRIGRLFLILASAAVLVLAGVWLLLYT